MTTNGGTVKIKPALEELAHEISEDYNINSCSFMNDVKLLTYLK